MEVKIGIIGGSGLENPEILTDAKEINIPTAFGDPSDSLLQGTISGVPCVLLSRHGRKHSIMPSNVNYRANLLALKNLGCTHILSTAACGSLQDKIHPGHLVIVDQFIDRTTKRHQTFYDGTVDSFKGIMHLPMATPFCPRTREILYQSCLFHNYNVHQNGTMVVIEGPRFSSQAESRLFHQWNCDVIGMTIVPEVVLARELGLCYAAIGMVTDCDSYKEDKESVNVTTVMDTMKSNSVKAVNVIQKAIKTIAEQNWKAYIAEMKEQVECNLMK